MRDFGRDHRSAGAVEGYASAQTGQRVALGKDLLRLEATGPNTGERSALSPVVPNVVSGSVGAALGQLVSLVSARTIIWGAAQLTEAATALGSESTTRGVDASLYTDTRVMNIISHAIEERIIRDGLATEVYAGFQRFSLVRPQLRRYQALLDVAEYVLVYGLDDLPAGHQLPPHPRLVPVRITPELETGLEAFWFVVVYHPRLCTALLARHTSGDLWSRAQTRRQYTGFWTFDPDIVEQVIATLRQGARILYGAR